VYYCYLFFMTVGELYSFGCNSNGQLGFGTTSYAEYKTNLIKSLHGLPISHIACGGNFSFVVSRSGINLTKVLKKAVKISSIQCISLIVFRSCLWLGKKFIWSTWVGRHWGPTASNSVEKPTLSTSSLHKLWKGSHSSVDTWRWRFYIRRWNVRAAGSRNFCKWNGSQNGSWTYGQCRHSNFMWPVKGL
jgi:hypothetical protein